MKILLDTQCWLWWQAVPSRLNPKARGLLKSGRNRVFLSAASSWEIAIKYALGKLRLPMPPTRYVPDRLAHGRIEAIPVEHAHALQVALLPLHHRDPFDRLLIAQAMLEGLPIMSADPSFSRYDVEVIPAGL